jgi:hypothetical protein
MGSSSSVRTRGRRGPDRVGRFTICGIFSSRARTAGVVYRHHGSWVRVDPDVSGAAVRTPARDDEQACDEVAGTRPLVTRTVSIRPPHLEPRAGPPRAGPGGPDERDDLEERRDDRQAERRHPASATLAPVLPALLPLDAVPGPATPPLLATYRAPRHLPRSPPTQSPSEPSCSSSCASFPSRPDPPTPAPPTACAALIYLACRGRAGSGVSGVGGSGRVFRSRGQPH